MTTVDPDDDIEKLPHMQWDSTAVPGPSGCMFPSEMTPLECQIAGHPFNGEKQTIGTLVCRQTEEAQRRYKGRFCTKRKIKWMENVGVANKRRHMAYRKQVENNYVTLTGRRLIDLDLLADELWCKSCNVPTSLRHVTKEDRMGLASIFHVTYAKPPSLLSPSERSWVTEQRSAITPIRTNEQILENAMTVESLITQEQRSLQCKIRKTSLECLKHESNPQEPDAKSSGISTSMVTKIAKAGITLEDLLQSYNTSGRRGIEILLGQDIGGHPRVTKTKKVIDGLSYKLAKLTKKSELVDTT